MRRRGLAGLFVAAFVSTATAAAPASALPSAAPISFTNTPGPKMRFAVQCGVRYSAVADRSVLIAATRRATPSCSTRSSPPPDTRRGTLTRAQEGWSVRSSRAQLDAAGAFCIASYVVQCGPYLVR
jgi:hypothetical protein